MENQTWATFLFSLKEKSLRWAELQKKIYTLKGIKLVAVISGTMAWFIISLFLFFLLSIFILLTLGWWFSTYTGSYVTGFGLVTLLIVLKIILLALFRKKLFINPLVKWMISKLADEKDNTDMKTEKGNNEKE